MADPHAVARRPPPTSTVTTSISHSQSISYQGQLPPPEMLARFNEIIPNGADRIVAMAESQQKHRQALESRVVNGNVTAQALGQWFAFIIGIVAVTGGIWLISQDKPTSGLVTILTALAALTGTFIYGRRSQERERVRKQNEMREVALQRNLPLGDQAE